MTNTGAQKKSGLFSIAGVFICLLIGLSVHYTAMGEWLDAKYFDLQTRVLRQHFPTTVANDVVVVGIDEDTVKAFPEPMTLWHRHWGDFLRAMNEADASAIGLDVIMPERSFNDLVPGYDESLMMGMLASRKKRPLVLGLTLNSQGEQRALYRKFEVLAGDSGLGFVLFPRDIDLKVRRFDEHLSGGEDLTPTLIGQMVRGMNIKPSQGYIDMSTGAAFNYVPLHSVVSRFQNGDIESLRKQFGGKAVLLGTVLPAEDRLAMPVNLAAWEDGWEGNGNEVSGVLMHAQTLRGFLNQGLIQPTTTLIVSLGILLSASWWLLNSSPRSKWLLAFLWSIGLLVLNLYLFRQGMYLPISAMTITALLALLGRGGIDALAHLKERRLLKSAFGNSVSPHVMAEILSGQITPELGGTRKFVAILFSDIRGFTTRSESMTPEAGIQLLNRYFECVVEKIHDNGGAVINFMGDGIMAIFGEPKPLDNPCAAGFEAAKAMQAALAVLNEQLKTEGITPIEIGVGVHAGEVVIGHMGSSNRNDYTAIGDAANVASRVEGLTKDVGYSIVCSKIIIDALVDNTGLVPLGPQPIKGHTPVEVYGWGKL
ncbi:MAG: adenylate/guanylate cyclase domain-containing protein [Arenimonas sp.]